MHIYIYIHEYDNFRKYINKAHHGLEAIAIKNKNEIELELEIIIYIDYSGIECNIL